MKRTLAIAALTALLIPACADEGEEMPELLAPRDEKPLAFANPDDCAECHSQHVEEWEISNHAYAMKDPVFLAMVEVGQEQTEGKLGQFCVQCHSPTGMATEQTTVYFDEDLNKFRQNLTDLDPIAQRGVSCTVCHSMTDVVEPVNARSVLTPDGVQRATIKDPIPNKAHESAYSELHATSDMCGSCHAVINPKGALIEETFGEWAVSSAAAEGKTCQSCHMPEYTGKATDDAPERTLHRHFFVGVDVSLLAPEEFPGYQEMRDMTAELLRSAVEFEARADEQDRRVNVLIRNLAGHAVPSGATAERQMWVEMLVRNADGEVVFESGTLDENDDIRDAYPDHTTQPGTDPQLIYYGQQLIKIDGFAELPDDNAKKAVRQMVDEACQPMGVGVDPLTGFQAVAFPWKADWQCNFMIPPDETSRAGYDLSELPSGEYTASLKLNFRTFPPYFLRKLEELGGLDPAVKTRLPTVLMAEQEVSFTLP